MSSEAPDSRAELSVDPEIVSTRVLPADRTTVFQAFLEPDALASWWGPAGFTNEFHSFEPRPGGSWTFTMHGPDGASHAMVKEFEKVQPSETIVIRHLEPPEHRFRLAMTFAEATGGTTLLTWRMRFESPAEAQRVRPVVEAANEENFDRLQAFLADARARAAGIPLEDE